MSQIIYQVDSFTNKLFAGNPAGVCILAGPAEEGWMRSVAREMNLSETAFLYRQDDDFNLRWFTPAVEVDLCGHATLATAHALWEAGTLKSDQQARFHTRSGLLTAQRNGDWIDMDFPGSKVTPTTTPDAILEAFDVKPVFMGETNFDEFIEVESESVLRGLKPDFGMLATIPTRGFIVTCASDSPEYDFVSRFFAPSAGINEDPVTGSAHCALGPYWQAKLGKDELVGFQASERGGVVRVKVQGDRVVLSGQAVTVLRAELL